MRFCAIRDYKKYEVTLNSLSTPKTLMLFLLVIFLLAGCEKRISNTVGYDHQLDPALEQGCFDDVFESFKEVTQYKLTIPMLEQNDGKVSYYELRIDGSAANEMTSTFVSASYQLSEDFLLELNNICIR